MGAFLLVLPPLSETQWQERRQDQRQASHGRLDEKGDREIAPPPFQRILSEEESITDPAQEGIIAPPKPPETPVVPVETDVKPTDLYEYGCRVEVAKMFKYEDEKKQQQ